MQTKLQSLLEILANYVIAFIVAWLAQFYVLPLYGFPASKQQVTEITLIFTFISITRSYICRRVFNRLHK